VKLASIRRPVPKTLQTVWKAADAPTGPHGPTESHQLISAPCALPHQCQSHKAALRTRFTAPPLVSKPNLGISPIECHSALSRNRPQKGPARRSAQGLSRVGNRVTTYPSGYSVSEPGLFALPLPFSLLSLPPALP
jgi:hypothetical protein